MPNLAEAIYDGKVGVEGAAGLRNPITKILTIAVPLGIVVFQHSARVFGSARLSNKELAIAAVVCYLAVFIDLEPKNRSQFTFRAVKWVLFVMGIYLLSIPSYEVYQEYLIFLGKSFHIAYSILDFFIDSESLMTILLFVPMYFGIRNFTTRDALWIGRKFLWGFLWNALFEIYMIVIVTVATINSALPLRVSVSWIVAKDKAMLLRNPHLRQRHSWFLRMTTRVRLFSSTLIGHNSRLASAIETMTHQRGMFRTRYQDHISSISTREDWIAAGLYFFGAFIVVMGRLN